MMKVFYLIFRESLKDFYGKKDAKREIEEIEEFVMKEVFDAKKN